MNRHQSVPLAGVLLILASAIVLAACNAGCGAELRAVPLPDLTRADHSVRTQLREQHAAVMEKQARGVKGSELASAYGELGIMLHAAEYFDAAAPAYFNAQALAPDDPRWPYYLGHLHRGTGQVDRAIEAFTRATELRRDDLPTIVWLARTYLDQGRAADAEPWLSKAQTLAPGEPAVAAAVAQAALARNDYRTAATLLERALALNPRAVSLHAPLAAAYRGLGETAKAEAHLQQWKDVQIPLADPLMEHLAVILRSAVSFESRGVRALDEGKWVEAASFFRQGLELTSQETPIRRSLLHKLGLALYLGGDRDSAIRQFEAATRLAPAVGHDEPASRVHYSLGIIAASGGDDDRAVHHLSRAVAYDASSVSARLALADALSRRGRNEAALPHYAEAIRLDARAAPARLGHALALVRLRRWRDARASLEASVVAQPDRPELAHALARVLATAPDPAVRDGQRAAEIVDALFKTSRRIEVGETMAMVLAELGDYDKAAAIQRGVIDAAQRASLPDVVRRLQGNLRLYEQRRPCREPWANDDPVHRPGALAPIG